MVHNCAQPKFAIIFKPIQTVAKLTSLDSCQLFLLRLCSRSVATVAKLKLRRYNLLMPASKQPLGFDEIMRRALLVKPAKDKKKSRPKKTTAKPCK
jgi:hypothetical protein